MSLRLQAVRLRLSKAQDILVATLKIWIALGQNPLTAQKLSVSTSAILISNSARDAHVIISKFLMEALGLAKALENFALVQFVCFPLEPT